MSTPSPHAVKAWLLGLQARIVQALEEVDGKPFLRDAWERPEGGGGISRLIEEGNVIERGGVNFSHVTGANLPPSAMAARPELAGRAWEAMGVSLVLHPRFKKWCDDYFYLKHRKEPRGVGGIFFDDFNEAGFDQSFAMVQRVGDSFLDAYLPILAAR